LLHKNKADTINLRSRRDLVVYDKYSYSHSIFDSDYHFTMLTERETNTFRLDCFILSQYVIYLFTAKSSIYFTRRNDPSSNNMDSILCHQHDFSFRWVKHDFRTGGYWNWGTCYPLFHLLSFYK